MRDRREPLVVLAGVLVLAAAVRLAGSVVGGCIALSLHHDEFAPASQRAGSILQTFGTGGDTAGALLLVAAAALIRAGRVRDPRLRLISRLLLLVTAVLVCMRLAGVYVIGADFSAGGAIEESVVTGFGIADLILCYAGLYLLGQTEAVSVDDSGSEPEPLLFAVDRGNGEVFAFFSYAEAARTIGVYSIEGDEFDFYTDEGDVVHASVTDGRTMFAMTDDNRRDELVSALRRFATMHDLDVEPGSDLTAYAVPISDWQWLQLWPGWMRGLGRVVRSVRG